VPRREQLRQRVDAVGMALGIVQADAPAWSRADVAVAVFGGLAALAAFVAWARHTPAPLVDLALFQLSRAPAACVGDPAGIDARSASGTDQTVGTGRQTPSPEGSAIRAAQN
jgi:hypothetical protein